MHSRVSRVARGWLVGAAAVLLAALSHDVGGGRFPGWLGIAVGTIVAGTLGMLALPAPARAATPPAAPSRSALARLAAVVVLGQGGFHYLFAALGGPASGVPGGSSWPVGAGHDGAHHAESGGRAAGLTNGATGVDGADVLVGSGAAHTTHLADPMMLSAHLVAALLTIAVIGWAERAMRRLVAETARLVIRPLARRLAQPVLAVPIATPEPARADWLLPALRSHLAGTSCPRRGPPVFSFT